MADAQAEGNSPGPGGAETGGTLRPVERQTRKPPSADPLGMARHPHADRSEKVDLTAAGDDVQGDPVAQSPICARHGWSRRIDFHRSRGSHPSCQGAGSDPHRRAGRSPGECGTESVARHRQRTRCESRGCCDLSVAAACRQCENGRREARATACSPRAGFPRPGADRTTAGRTAHQQGRLRRPDSSATASLRG